MSFISRKPEKGVRYVTIGSARGIGQIVGIILGILILLIIFSFGIFLIRYFLTAFLL